MNAARDDETSRPIERSEAGMPDRKWELPDGQAPSQGGAPQETRPAPKVLFVDDSAVTHCYVRASMHGEPVEILAAYDGVTALDLARRAAPDVILLDLKIPGPDGFEVCRLLKADRATADIPIIFLSADDATAQKIRGLELGAADYITKPFNPEELRARLRASLRTKYTIDLLTRRAMIDGLTGLWNRPYLEYRLASEDSLARRHGRPLSCVMLDVDHFKSINDRCGHAFGDAVLRRVAVLLADACRGEDIACRYGGEEFVVVLPSTPACGAAVLADRMRAGVEGLGLSHRGRPVAVTASLGVADLAAAHAAGDRPLLELADEAMYRAKGAGRNRVETAAAPVASALPAAESAVPAESRPEVLSAR
jgi:diguanylate cyclase (GGDEF)-like protein